MGDLNYRIQLPCDEVKNRIHDLEYLLQHDQVSH
jgi:hypothetical protein